MKLKRIFLGMTGLAVAAVMAHNANALAVETFTAKTAGFDVTKIIHTNATTYDNVPVFNFAVTKVSVENLPDSSTTTVATMPTLTIAPTVNTAWTDSDVEDETYVYAKEQKLKATVNFTEMGTYTYTFKEVPNADATNVTYDETEYKAVFEVFKIDEDDDGVFEALDYNCHIVKATDAVEDANKTDAVFDNDISTRVDTYVQKKVTGAKGDTSKDFSFNITLTDATQAHDYIKQELIDGTWTDMAGTAGTIAKDNLTLTINLKDNQRVVIKDLEVASKYTVVESGALDYSTAIDVVNAKGTDVESGKTVSNVEVYGDGNGVVYTNKKDNIIDTGVMLNVMPYGIVVATAAIGIFAIAKSSRRKEEE